MAKGIIEFNLPEEGDEFRMALDASKYQYALMEIGQLVFRPARKHGYSEVNIQSLIEKGDEVKVEIDGHSYGVATELISQLEKLFYEILEKEGIKI